MLLFIFPTEIRKKKKKTHLFRDFFVVSDNRKTRNDVKVKQKCFQRVAIYLSIFRYIHREIHRSVVCFIIFDLPLNLYEIKCLTHLSVRMSLILELSIMVLWCAVLGASNEKPHFLSYSHWAKGVCRLQLTFSLLIY